MGNTRNAQSFGKSRAIISSPSFKTVETFWSKGQFLDLESQNLSSHLLVSADLENFHSIEGLKLWSLECFIFDGITTSSQLFRIGTTSGREPKGWFFELTTQSYVLIQLTIRGTRETHQRARWSGLISSFPFWTPRRKGQFLQPGSQNVSSHLVSWR